MHFSNGAGGLAVLSGIRSRVIAPLSDGSPGRSSWQLGRGLLLCMVAALPLLSGCISPAEPDEFAFEPEPEQPLGGHYDATFHTVFVGPVTARVMAEATETGVKANTRPNVAWSMLGGLEGAAGPLLAPFIFPNGMILTWESTLPKDGEPGRGTIGIASLASLRVPTIIHSTNGPIEIRFRDNRLIGLVELSRIDVPEGVEPPPLKTVDYTALVARAREELPRMLFDPSVVESGTIVQYLDDLDTGAAAAKDEVEFLFTTGVAARKHIKFGFPLMYPRSEGAMAPLLAAHKDAPRPYKVTFDESTRIATIRFEAFVEDEWVDAAFTEAIFRQPQAIILDLRACPGVTLAAFRTLRWLADRPLSNRLLIGARMYQKAPNVTWRTPGAQTNTPSGAAASNVEPLMLPGTVADDHTTQQDLLRVLESTDMLSIEMAPQPSAFVGPVAVLISRRTSSTAEMLADTLASSGRATLIGETSGGRPTLTREVDVGQGWVLRAPAYQYFGAGGSVKLGKGLNPQIKASRDAAPKVAAEHLLRELGVTRPVAVGSMPAP
jgi:hypothetical protein